MNSSSSLSLRELDLNAIAARLRLLLGELEVDGKKLSRQVQIPYGTLRAYLSAQRAPSAEFMARLYETSSVSPIWLLTGDGAVRLGQDSISSQDVILLQALLSNFEKQPSSESRPTQRVEQELPSYALPVHQQWIREKGLNKDSLSVLKVQGHAMSPLLQDGDMVVVDRSQQEPLSGHAYVNHQNNEFIIRYCQLMPNQHLRMSSANLGFAPYDVKWPDENVKIMGRIVASFHSW